MAIPTSRHGLDWATTQDLILLNNLAEDLGVAMHTLRIIGQYHTRPEIKLKIREIMLAMVKAVEEIQLLVQNTR